MVKSDQVQRKVAELGFSVISGRKKEFMVWNCAMGGWANRGEGEKAIREEVK